MVALRLSRLNYLEAASAPVIAVTAVPRKKITQQAGPWGKWRGRSKSKRNGNSILKAQLRVPWLLAFLTGTCSCDSTGMGGRDQSEGLVVINPNSWSRSSSAHMRVLKKAHPSGKNRF